MFEIGKTYEFKILEVATRLRFGGRLRNTNTL